MTDYDVIVIGGGINGLTAAAYLGKAGLKVCVVEARGECGAHCDTIEAGIPGFLFNLHAVWMVTPLSPAMTDLELEKHGLEFRRTDYAWGKVFSDGKNALAGNDPFDTIENWGKHSVKDAALMEKAIGFFTPNMLEFVDLMDNWLYRPPSRKITEQMISVTGRMFRELGVPCTGEEFMRLNGFEVMDRMFESDYIKTLALALGWIAGFNPMNKTIGAMGATILGLLVGPFYPSVIVRGGSHELTHVLVKAAISNGVKIMPNCPVEKILVENGSVCGVQLADHSVFPGERITCKKVISNVSLGPTFLDMVGEEHTGHDMASKIKGFVYDEQNLFTVHYALDDAPEFASAEFDDGIQRCYMGYFGGDTPLAMKKFGEAIKPENRIIPDELMCNYFITTLADPLQAPKGCHTTHVWVDIPPEPSSWKHGKLNGFADWDNIKEKFADEIDNHYEKYAPGFKNLIRERIVYTPADQYRNNPSAVLGNWAGGAMIPGQFYDKRPMPGILKNGATRTFIDNLYLSNSIHVASNSTLASGYLAACEVALDMGVRENDWWNSKACVWYLENMFNIPSNEGVKS